jgi:lipopolysaccharide transport protein LptA
MRLTILLFLVMLYQFDAFAQIFGGDDPIRFRSDKATYEGNTTILVGSVDVVQGPARIKSDTMTIFRSNPTVSDGNDKLGAISRIEAIGNFHYTTPQNDVKGTRGVYERDKGTITVSGNVKVKQPGGNTASTDRLVYNIETETIMFSGECRGEDCSGRPTIRFGN